MNTDLSTLKSVFIVPDEPSYSLLPILQDLFEFSTAGPPCPIMRVQTFFPDRTLPDSALHIKAAGI